MEWTEIFLKIMGCHRGPCLRSSIVDEIRVDFSQGYGYHSFYVAIIVSWAMAGMGSCVL